MKNIGAVFLVLLPLVIISCDNSMEMEMEMEEEVLMVSTSGILNGMDFSNESTANSSETEFGFRYFYETDSVVCNQVDFSFRNIPLEVGTYEPLQYSGDPDEGVFCYGGIACGDLAFAAYNLADDFDHTLQVTEVTDNSIQGIFSISFVLDTVFEAQYPETFFFEDLSFFIER